MLRKKYPILTATICTTIEQIRLAVEVLTGKRTSFIEVDFNTCLGKLSLQGVETRLDFYRRRSDLININIGSDWHTARFEDGKVFVKSEKWPREIETVAGKFTLLWFGSSVNDRREQPLLLRQAEYCAKVRNLTLEELLQTQTQT